MLVDLHRLEEIGRARSVPSEALNYLELFLLGAIDTALAAQNAVVALESLGLPPHVFALFGLAIGHPDPAALASVKPRLPEQDWTEQVAHRVRGPEALAGRDALHGVLKGLGFGLK